MDEPIILQVPATITKISTMADRSMRLQVDCERELSPDEGSLLLQLSHTIGFFIFKLEEIKEEDLINLPKEKLEFKDSKSPSEILRNRMFVYYKESYGKTDGFDDWRKKELDKIGQSYLNRVNN